MAGKKAKPGAAKSAGKKEIVKKTQKAGPLGSIKKMLGLNAAAKDQVRKVTDEKSTLAAKGGKSVSKDVTPAKGVVKAAPVDAFAKLSTEGKSGKKRAEKNVQPVTAAGKMAQAAGKAGAAIAAAKAGRAAPAVKERSERIVGGPPVCREVACELMATTASYCRMHYIKNWKKIKRKQMILKERKLNHYIEELVSKYPDKYIEAIRQDLASEKDFAKVISDLEIEEGLDDFESVETESAEGIIDNLKRDFEDDGDVF